MFSTMKKLATLSVVLSVFNIIGIILLYLFIGTFNLGFAFEFGTFVFLVSTGVIFLALSCGILGMCTDLQYQHDSTMERLVDLRKRVEQLEHRS